MQDNANIVFAKNKKGTNNVLLNGYAYTKNKSNNVGSSLWRCANRNICSASLKLSSENLVLKVSDHDCRQNYAKNKMSIIIDKCKQAVCQTFGSVPEIMEDVILNEPDSFIDENIDVAALFRSKKDSLYRARNKFLEVKKTNDSLSEIQVPNIIAQNFLVCNDCYNNKKILIFSSPLAQKILKTLENGNAHYYGDGTFQTVPLFYQLYTIHVNVNAGNNDTVNIVPVIYCLLPDKTQDTYIRLFQLIKNEMQIDFKKFKSDYEVAQIQALKAVFPGIEITGCYYHYSRAVWKKAEKFGILTTTAGNTFTELCAHLPLVPTDYIPEVWQNIKELPEIMTRFVCYMEKQWMGQLHNIISCAHEIHRTNNSLEGWHRRLNNRMKGKPSFINFIFKLKKESQWQSLKLKQYLFEGNARRRIDINFNSKHKKELQKLQEGDISALYFLKSMIKTKKELMSQYND